MAHHCSGLPSSASSVSEAIPNKEAGCPFCHIAECYAPFDPLQPPPTSNKALSSGILTQPATFILLSTPLLLAFLDIAPLSRGHLLLCPRKHREKLTEVTPVEAAELGCWLRILSAASTRATCVEDWNIVQNNGAAAAQVVPHAHFHIIPRPEIREQGRWSERFTMFGRGRRTDLDDEEATVLAENIRRSIVEVLKEEESRAKL